MAQGSGTLGLCRPVSLHVPPCSVPEGPPGEAGGGHCLQGLVQVSDPLEATLPSF